MKPKLLDENWRPLEFRSGNSVPVTSKIMTEDMVKSLIRQTEEATISAVVALMHKHRPMVWFIEENEEQGAYYTNYEQEAMDWDSKGVEVTPFYAIPDELIPNQPKKEPICPKCDNTLTQEEVSGGYMFECQQCDEDFYEFEVRWREK